MAQMTDEQLRQAYSEIPSDLPTNVPLHPGKPLTRRFEAEKFPRQIIRAPIGTAKKLASELNFKPVTTMDIANKNVHVKPISNVRPRVISPLDKGALQLLVRGELVIDDSTGTQKQVQERLDKKLEQFFAKPKFTPAPTVATQPKRQTPPPPKTPIEKSTVEAPAPAPTAINTQQPPTPNTPPLVTQEKETGADVDQLKTEVGTLRDLLNQSDVDKTVSQRRVIELTNKYQVQVATITQEKSQLNGQLTGLRNKLMEETKRRMASENSSVSVATQLKTEINKMKIERDGLLGKLKESQDKITAMQEQQAKATEASVTITQLKAKLAQIETEKDDTDKKSIKLEALVSDLQNKSNQPVEAKEVIIPKEVDDKSKNAPVRIVHPDPAIGRMAPQLTTVPNVVSGVIKDINGMLLSDVVLVVKDSVGNSVRALKSNKIGRFAISTPLPNGVYTMELEKEGNEFDIVQINLEGEIMLPIEIRAR